MGVGGIDQTAAMKQAVTEIAQLTDAPLAIDTSDASSLEAGLRAYPGRALINSVSAENDRIRDFLPLAKKYGAAILCLPITEDGVPKTAEDRLKAIEYIVGKAKENGLDDGDFLLDALVMTVSADKNACREVLKTLQLYRQRLGYPSTMGLSNISFGLPNRPLINSTFFAMCLAAGLDAPIMNPYDESMQKALKASAALLGDDPCGLPQGGPGILQVVEHVGEQHPPERPVGEGQGRRVSPAGPHPRGHPGQHGGRGVQHPGLGETGQQGGGEPPRAAPHVQERLPSRQGQKIRHRLGMPQAQQVMEAVVVRGDPVEEGHGVTAGGVSTRPWLPGPAFSDLP